MSDDDFESEDDFDSTDESDPMIRELRLQIVRLEARLDQLMASDRERAAEMDELRVQSAELRAMIDDLARRIAVLEEWRKRFARRILLIGLAATVIGTALAQAVVYLAGW